MSDSVRPHRRQPTRLPRSWDSLGKNTGVGCHFLLQCMKVKTESEVTHSCPTLSDPMDGSQPGSSVHGVFQARVLEWVAIAFSTSMFIAALFTIGKTWDHTFRFLIHFELIFVNGMSKGPRVLLWKDFPSLIQFLLRYSNFLFLLLYFKSLKAKINHVKH